MFLAMQNAPLPVIPTSIVLRLLHSIHWSELRFTLARVLARVGTSAFEGYSAFARSVIGLSAGGSGSHHLHHTTGDVGLDSKDGGSVRRVSEVSKTTG